MGVSEKMEFALKAVEMSHPICSADFLLSCLSATYYEAETGRGSNGQACILWLLRLGNDAM